MAATLGPKTLSLPLISLTVKEFQELHANIWRAALLGKETTNQDEHAFACINEILQEKEEDAKNNKCHICNGFRDDDTLCNVPFVETEGSQCERCEEWFCSTCIGRFDVYCSDCKQVMVNCNHCGNAHVYHGPENQHCFSCDLCKSCCECKHDKKLKV
jgi:hypothetical protein